MYKIGIHLDWEVVKNWIVVVSPIIALLAFLLASSTFYFQFFRLKKRLIINGIDLKFIENFSNIKLQFTLTNAGNTDIFLTDYFLRVGLMLTDLETSIFANEDCVIQRQVISPKQTVLLTFHGDIGSVRNLQAMMLKQSDFTNNHIFIKLDIVVIDSKGKARKCSMPYGNILFENENVYEVHFSEEILNVNILSPQFTSRALNIIFKSSLIKRDNPNRLA